TSASFPAKTGTVAETVNYLYDLNGRAHSVQDNRGTTIYSYETGCDRVHSVQDPITGTVSYTYGLYGERFTMSLPGGGTWTYGYLPSTQVSSPQECFPKDDPNSVGPVLTSIT